MGSALDDFFPVMVRQIMALSRAVVECDGAVGVMTIYGGASSKYPTLGDW